MKSSYQQTKERSSILTFMRKITLFFVLVAFFFPFFTRAFADESAEPTPTPISQRSGVLFDKRLPPLMPGEEVQTENGKMKVWSSSGPVPMNAPTIDERINNSDSFDVIVDKRHHRKH